MDYMNDNVVLDILKFVFSSFWIFIGTAYLIAMIGILCGKLLNRLLKFVGDYKDKNKK